jgi:xylulokinase
MADIFNRPIERLTFLEEATSLGAAIAGGIAFGIFKNFDVAKKIAKVVEVQHPRPEVRERYDRAYVIFQEAYEALVPIYTKLQGL